ncbi:MAG TPA: tetratricopeptide repeat protein [Acidimicrobiales bacterium]
MPLWIDEGSVRDQATQATARATAAAPARKRRRRLPADVVAELERTAGRQRAPRIESRVAEARTAFEADRYRDAAQILAPLAVEVPDAPAVRELLGLTYYRLERWKKAAVELEAYRHLTGAFDEHPVLADCYRALRRWRAVDELWEELRAASPSAELVMEGRIVAAGALADRGRLEDAIAMMSPAASEPRRVQEHHLRAWYVLGDLHDRAGDPTTAASYFRRILRRDATFADVPERLAGLGQ